MTRARRPHLARIILIRLDAECYCVTVHVDLRQHGRRRFVGLNIRNPETERLAAAVARLTGETKTEAVTQALRDRLARLRRERSGRHLADELDEIARHCAGLPVVDARTPEEILGYDERGLPR